MISTFRNSTGVRFIYYPCTAADTISAMPMITEPMMIASEVFWSSSISFRIENGETLTMIQNANAKKINPTTVKTTVLRTDLANGSVGIISLLGLFHVGAVLRGSPSLHRCDV